LTGAVTTRRASADAPLAPALLDVRVDSPSSARPAGAAVRLVCAALVATSAAYFWGTNVADEDLWNHLTFGELKLRTHAVPTIDAWSYSAPGHPWFNHEWGAEVVFAALYRLGGTPALFALKFGLGLVILAAIAGAARLLARTRGVGPIHPATSAAVLVVVFAALGPGASFRPQLLTMTCLALEWWLLEQADGVLFATGTAGGALAAVPLVMLVWTNAHGGFPVGVGLHGIFVACVLVRTIVARRAGEPAPGNRALALVVASGVATLAATVVNPYGLGLHWYLTHTLADHGRITEWLPIPIVSSSHLPFKVLVVATIALAVPWLATAASGSARLDWRLAFIALAAVMAVRHQRHSVLFTIVDAPVLLVLAEALRRRLLARRPELAPRRPVVAVLAAGALGVAAVQLAGVTDRYVASGLAIPYARSEFPADAVAFLRAHDLHGNLAVQFEWGGYTIHHLGDAVRVFIDGRYEASYPPAVMDDYFTFIDAAPGWERVLDAYPTDGVMLDRSVAVVAQLERRPDLVRVYSDPTAVVYLRRDVAARAGLDAPTTVAWGADSGRATVFP
jgi:hypothetical protein